MENDNTRYERNPDYIYREVAGEAVLVPIRQQVADMDCIYALNQVGAMVWQELDAPATPDELRKAILEEYEAEPEAVGSDLERFLQEMVSVGAIRRA